MQINAIDGGGVIETGDAIDAVGVIDEDGVIETGDAVDADVPTRR